MNKPTGEQKRRHIEDCTLQVRSALDTLVYGYGVDSALRVLEDEKRLLLMRKADGEECSIEFERAVTNAGSVVVDCEHCKRTHFATWSEGFYEDGELENLRSNAKRAPDKYVEWGDVDTLSWGVLDGKQIVFGCPCNAGRRYELWIWSHRYIIADYLSARAKVEAARSNRISETAAKVSGAVALT